jgi:hypothetical protein
VFLGETQPLTEPAAAQPSVLNVTTSPTAPPERFAGADKMLLSHVGYQARKLWPGAIGELIQRELQAATEFGYRLGGAAMVTQLIEAVENTEGYTRPHPDLVPRRAR